MNFGFINNFTMLSSLLLVFGLLLVIVEMFHPGFGAPGIIGAGLLILSVYLTAGNDPGQAFLMLISILIFLGLILIFVLRSAAKGRLSKTLVLSESLKKESGFSGTDDLKEYLNKEGKTLTTLRPAGLADFDGVKLDVVSEGEYIAKDVNVKVIKVEGRRVVVKQSLI